MTSTTTVKHGSKRNWRIEREPNITQSFTDARGNELAVSYSPSEHSVVERYCAVCDSWTEQHGILDAVLAVCKDCGASLKHMPGELAQ